MALLFKVCGTEYIPPHTCSACISHEKGRLRGGAFIISQYIPRTPDGKIDASQVESYAWWETGINNGDIFVVPKTRGTFDGGSAITAPGYGDLNEMVTGKTFTAVMNDPDHKENEEFYNAIASAPGSYHFAFRTGSELRISDKPVNIDPVDAVEDDVNSDVVWAANITWDQDRKTVQVFDLANVKPVFECFETSGNVFYTTPAGFSVFSSSGGSQSVNVSSTVESVTVPFTVTGTLPSWLSYSITGGTLTVTPANNATASSRSFTMVLTQSGSGKTISRVITQAAGVLQTGNVYGGFNMVNAPLATESDVKALYVDTGTNPALINAQKGQQFSFGINNLNDGFWQICVVVPEVLGIPAKIWDDSTNMSLLPVVVTQPGTINVDGQECKVYYVQNMVIETVVKDMSVTI